MLPAGREWSDWSSELRIPGDELKWKFISDGSVNGWGWRFTVYPIMPAAGEGLRCPGGGRGAQVWGCGAQAGLLAVRVHRYTPCCGLPAAAWGACRAGHAGLLTGCPWCSPSGPKDLLSDRCVLSCPSMDLVTCLLDFRLNLASNRSIVPRLAASLAACAQLSALGRRRLHRRVCRGREEPC